MKLSELAGDLQGARTWGEASISGVSTDSRSVAPGDLFVAMKGSKADGADFVAEALRRGACALASEDWMEAVAVPQLRVPGIRKQLGALASKAYGYPSRDLAVIGITGTNGKTTTAHLIEAMLKEAEFEPACVGTVSYRWKGREREASNTTPEASDLQRMIRRMVEERVTHLVIECSSHGIELGRLDSLALDVAVFTNLTQDHLDFHGTMENYRQAKWKLFDVLLRESPKRHRCAVLNLDDPVGEEWSRSLDLPVVTFSARRDDADLWVENAHIEADGIRASLSAGGKSIALRSPLVGAHNLANLVAALAVGRALNLNLSAAAGAVGRVTGVPGRLERVENRRGVHVFVDYAHTEDALRNVLRALKSLDHRRLISVFGCGGDRDRLKRPRMAAVVAELADVAIVTSDNPRSEVPDAIIAEIVRGLPKGFPLVGADKLDESSHGVGCAIADRRAAIHRALEIGSAGDLVLLAGKGHETYQDVHGVRHPFDDREVARSWFRGRN